MAALPGTGVGAQAFAPAAAGARSEPSSKAAAAGACRAALPLPGPGLPRRGRAADPAPCDATRVARRRGGRHGGAATVGELTRVWD
jgi:hypothetical protein